MTALAAFYAEHALQLAHERQAGFRAEAEGYRRAGSPPRRPARFQAIRAGLAAARETLSPVEPGLPSTMPRLADYPYRG